MERKEAQQPQTSAKPEANKYENPNNLFCLHHLGKPRAILTSQQLNMDHQGRRSVAPEANFVDTKTAPTPTSYNLTGEQYQNLMALLNNSTPNPMASPVGNSSTKSDLSGMDFCASAVIDDTSWILDT